MSSTRILFSANTGLGCEIAKNVLLGGVKSLTLHDTKNASLTDLSSHFFLTEQVGPAQPGMSLRSAVYAIGVSLRDSGVTLIINFSFSTAPQRLC